MAHKQFRLILTQGEILGILIARKKPDRKRDDLAAEFGISKTHLSRLSSPTTLTLPKEIMKKAAEIFDIPESVFTDQATLESLSERMNNCESEIGDLRAEVENLKKQNEILSIEKSTLMQLIKN